MAPTAAERDDTKDIIGQLYIVGNNSLEDIGRFLQHERGLYATRDHIASCTPLSIADRSKTLYVQDENKVLRVREQIKECDMRAVYRVSKIRHAKKNDSLFTIRGREVRRETASHYSARRGS
jgi:Clr5 domain